MKQYSSRSRAMLCCGVFSIILSALYCSILGVQSLAYARQAGPQFQTIREGVEYIHITRGHKSDNESTGPWEINLLRVDAGKVDIRIRHALDEAVGLETTSSMAARAGAIAAVNGGYFRTAGTYRGDSTGAYKIDGKLMSEPMEGRAAFAVIEQAGQTEIIFGHLKFRGVIKTRSGELTVSGINRPRAPDELIIYTPEFHRTTLTSPDGVELIVRRGRIDKIIDGSGSNRIPGDGYVISASGKSRDRALNNLKTGERVLLDTEIVAVESKQSSLWSAACCIVGGGPQLIKDGRVEISAEAEKIGEKFVTDRHPRTAIARLKTGKLLFVTVDGRQPGLSVGMSLTELAALLLEFDATDAINLDGGGSTTMVIDGKLVNKPSDATGERPVSDAILIVPKTKKR